MSPHRAVFGFRAFLDSLPRTWMAIAQEKESMDDLEGLDKVRAWLQNIYIFGLFEGATGQEAPWYLKPVRYFFFYCSPTSGDRFNERGQ